jgi:hypothetical protein
VFLASPGDVERPVDTSQGAPPVTPTVADGLVPSQMISRYRETDPKRYQGDRSLLFVTATRERDELHDISV